MDKVLKRRLIGASILIALAVIFVPMLLVDPDSVEQGSGDGVDIPPMPESARQVRRIPLDPEAARVAEDESGVTEPGREAAADAAGQSESETAPVRPDDAIVLRPDLEASRQGPPTDDGGSMAEPGEAAVDPDADPEAGEPAPASRPEGQRDDEAPESRPAEPAAPISEAQAGRDDIALGDWVVQVASFGSRESADQVRDRLEALGHRVARDEIVRGQSLLHRLRTGPYASREAAERARRQIATTVAGVEPIVREVDGDLQAGMDAGFAVQVGSFVSPDNAESETGRLNDLGFDAFRFSEQVGERTIWRVVVGPVDERAAAEALASRLVEQAGVDGLVISYP